MIERELQQSFCPTIAEVMMVRSATTPYDYFIGRKKFRQKLFAESYEKYEQTKDIHYFAN